ncbi:potassium channel family protein [Pseudofulvibacter geojedonensis]|uniref:Potassium channel family protein n=1 Tax=Pseudofulvibacter geojedonensis TaxID=1123758 RepID=A0ABW3I0Y8_9FLAO
MISLILKSKIKTALLLFGTILLIGVVGFRIIADLSWVDALYMTVITISTVGYGEVAPLSEEAKVFAIFLILASVFFITYAISVISEYIVKNNDFQLLKQRKMKKKVDQLNGHVIICGYGRNGKQAAQKLSIHNKSFVVIERDKELIEKYENDVLFVHGNANEDDVLQNAGVERAHSLIAALPKDADNLFVVLSARQLNKELTIISRASQETSYNKLKLAGANNVIMPDKIGGDHMASLVVIPDLVEFLDNLSIIGEDTVNIEEVAIEALTSNDTPHTIKDLDFRRNTGCTIIGYKKPSGEYVINPEADTQLLPNSKLIVLGRPEQITKLNSMFGL